MCLSVSMCLRGWPGVGVVVCAMMAMLMPDDDLMKPPMFPSLEEGRGSFTIARRIVLSGGFLF